MGNALEKIIENAANAVANVEAHREMPERFRRAALLSFGIYDECNDNRDRPNLPSDVKEGLGSESEIWSGYDYKFTEGMNHHSTYTCPSTHVKYSIHYIKTQIDTLMVWVTFRGTVDLPNWIANVTCALTPPAVYKDAEDESILVHAGFHLSYLSARTHLLADFRRLPKSVYSITVVGHSLGGALATNMVFDILKNTTCFRIDQSNKVGLITFGAPPAGNKNFVESIKVHIKAMTYSLQPYCFVNKADLVPHSLKLKTDIAAPLINKKGAVSPEAFVHASDVVELDNEVVAGGRIAHDIRNADSLVGSLTACCLGPHSGQAYIENMEFFLSTDRGERLLKHAAESSNFAAEVGLSALAQMASR
jgi:pimeloyl-ACP methyl ester carboxylesterase